MKTRAALLMQAPGEFEVAEVELDEPRQDELLVRMVSAGLCHSDDHAAVGDLPVAVFPWCGGHEGAGVVEHVGPHTEGWSVGDHVVFNFVPACGRCLWCARGMQHLCNLGAHTLSGGRIGEPTKTRMHLDGRPVGQMSSIGTFSELTTVSTASVQKVPPHVALPRLALLACGVSTGWGSAVNAAAVQPGQTVVVMGIGGIGAAAVQGAVHAGAQHVIAVDPVPFKHGCALELGATHAVSSMDDAREIAAGFTDGQGADAAIVTVGVTRGEHVAAAVDVIRKGGTVVVTGAGPDTVSDVPINLLRLTMMEKRIVGSLFGSASPRSTIPWLTDLYHQGRIKLDEMVTKVYPFEDIAQGFRDMKSGTILRGVVDFPS